MIGLYLTHLALKISAKTVPPVDPKRAAEDREAKLRIAQDIVNAAKVQATVVQPKKTGWS